MRYIKYFHNTVCSPCQHKRPTTRPRCHFHLQAVFSARPTVSADVGRTIRVQLRYAALKLGAHCRSSTKFGLRRIICSQLQKNQCKLRYLSHTCGIRSEVSTVYAINGNLGRQFLTTNLARYLVRSFVSKAWERRDRHYCESVHYIYILHPVKSYPLTLLNFLLLFQHANQSQLILSAKESRNGIDC